MSSISDLNKEFVKKVVNTLSDVVKTQNSLETNNDPVYRKCLYFSQHYTKHLNCSNPLYFLPIFNPFKHCNGFTKAGTPCKQKTDYERDCDKARFCKKHLPLIKSLNKPTINDLPKALLKKLPNELWHMIFEYAFQPCQETYGNEICSKVICRSCHTIYEKTGLYKRKEKNNYTCYDQNNFYKGLYILQ